MTPVPRRRRWAQLSIGAVLFWLAAHHSASALGLAPKEPAPLRCIVALSDASAPNAPETLKMLSEHAQAPVSYLDSVSSTTHIYSVRIAENQDIFAMLARLRTAPQVRHVSLDQQRQRH